MRLAVDNGPKAGMVCLRDKWKQQETSGADVILPEDLRDQLGWVDSKSRDEGFSQVLNLEVTQ